MNSKDAYIENFQFIYYDQYRQYVILFNREYNISIRTHINNIKQYSAKHISTNGFTPIGNSLIDLFNCKTY